MDFNKSIEQIEKTLGYTFRDKSLLKQAFTRESYCNENNRGKTKFISNEVLEFFGDSILSAAIVSLLLKGRTKKYEYGIYTELGEGDFSTIRSNLSDKKNLSSAMGALGLEKYLLLSRGDAKLGIEKEPSVMEDLYESIIGAIYIDSGMDLSVVVSVVERTLDVSSYISEAEAPKKNAKNGAKNGTTSISVYPGKLNKLPTGSNKLASFPFFNFIGVSSSSLGSSIK